MSVGLVENQYLKGYAEQDQYRHGYNLPTDMFGIAVANQVISNQIAPPPPRSGKISHNYTKRH